MSNKINTTLENIVSIITNNYYDKDLHIKPFSLDKYTTSVERGEIAHISCACGNHSSPEDTLNIWIDNNKELAINIWSSFTCKYNTNNLKYELNKLLEDYQESTGESILLPDGYQKAPKTISPHTIPCDISTIEEHKAKIERECVAKSATKYKEGMVFNNKEVKFVYDFKDETGEVILQALYDANKHFIGSNHTKQDKTLIPYALPRISQARRTARQVEVISLRNSGEEVLQYMQGLKQWNLWKQCYFIKDSTGEVIKDKETGKRKVSKIFCKENFINLSGEREKQGRGYNEVAETAEKLTKNLVSFYSEEKKKGLNKVMDEKELFEFLEANPDRLKNAKISTVSKWIPEELGAPIGFLPTLNDRIVFLDFDKVLHTAGSIPENQWKLPKELGQCLSSEDIECCYVELSQSETGLHVLLLVKTPEIKEKIKTWLTPAVKETLNTSAKCEIYVRNQLIALTHKEVKGCEVIFQKEEIKALPNLWLVATPEFADLINGLDDQNNIATTFHKGWGSSWTNSYKECLKDYNIYILADKADYEEEEKLNTLCRNLLQKSNNWIFKVLPQIRVEKIDKETEEVISVKLKQVTVKELLTSLEASSKEVREKTFKWLVTDNAEKVHLPNPFEGTKNIIGNITYKDIEHLIDEKEEYLELNANGDATRVVELSKGNLKYYTSGDGEVKQFYSYDANTGCWNTTKEGVEGIIRQCISYITEERMRFPLSEKKRKAVNSWQKQSLTSANISAVMNQLGIHKGIRLSTDVFSDTRDDDTKLKEGIWINCPNGMINLVDKTFIEVTNKATEAYRNMHFLKCTGANYIPDKDCTEAIKFIKEIFIDAKPEWEGKKYELVMHLLGHCLTGLCVEDKGSFPNFYETGSNGKTSFFNCVLTALGGYALDARSNVNYLLRPPQGMSEREKAVFKASLRGYRLLYFEEPEKGATIDMDELKSVLMHGHIKARLNHANSYVEFDPECCMFLSLNNQLTLKDNTDGATRRIIQVPCTQKFVKEADGIHPLADLSKLMWCNDNNIKEQFLWLIVDYANKYLAKYIEIKKEKGERSSALPDCPECNSASNVYFQSQDIVLSFLASEVSNFNQKANKILPEVTADKVPSKKLYERFKQYIEEAEGIPAMFFDKSKYGKEYTPRKFTERIKKLGGELVTGSRGLKDWVGIQLIPKVTEELEEGTQGRGELKLIETGASIEEERLKIVS